MRAMDDYQNVRRALEILQKPNGVVSSWANSDGFGVSIKREADRCYSDTAIRDAALKAFAGVREAFDAAFTIALKAEATKLRQAAVDEFANLMDGAK